MKCILSQCEAFIQAVLLMSIFEQRLSLQMFQNAGGSLKVLYALQRVLIGALEGVPRAKRMKNFGLFTSGVQKHSLK